MYVEKPGKIADPSRVCGKVGQLGHVKSDGQRLSRLKAVYDVLLGGGEYDCEREGTLE
jgi:hypothetical protein